MHIVDGQEDRRLNVVTHENTHIDKGFAAYRHQHAGIGFRTHSMRLEVLPAQLNYCRFALGNTR
jgi:hypothetical protein